MFSFFKNLFGSKKSTCKSSCCGGSCAVKKVDTHDHVAELKLKGDADIAALKAVDPLVVVGKVLTVEDHPNPKMTKVKVATVQLDKSGTKETICCGGTNLAAGQIVATAKVGAKLSPEFEIGIRDLRGVESRGMICARKELGLSLNGEGDKEIWPMGDHYEAHLGQSVNTLV